MLTMLNDALPRPRWMALSADPVLRGLVGLAIIGFGVGQAAQINAANSPFLGLTGVCMMVFGASLAAGLWTRLSALILIVIWSATTVPSAAAEMLTSRIVGPGLESLAMLGALFLIYVRGGGSVSVDGARRKRAPVAKPRSGGRTISRL